MLVCSLCTLGALSLVSRIYPQVGVEAFLDVCTGSKSCMNSSLVHLWNLFSAALTTVVLSTLPSWILLAEMCCCWKDHTQIKKWHFPFPEARKTQDLNLPKCTVSSCQVKCQMPWFRHAPEAAEVAARSLRECCVLAQSLSSASQQHLNSWSY